MFKDIDKAIEYTRKVSRLNKNRFWGEVIIYTRIDIDKKIGYSPAECAEEYNQIAEWLEELKELKKKWLEADAYNEGFKDGRADAIDESKEYWDMQNHKAYEQGRQDVLGEVATRLEGELIMVMPRDNVKFLMYKVHTVLEQFKENKE